MRLKRLSVQSSPRWKALAPLRSWLFDLKSPANTIDRFRQLRYPKCSAQMLGLPSQPLGGPGATCSVGDAFARRARRAEPIDLKNAPAILIQNEVPTDVR